MKVRDASFDLDKFIALVKARTAIYAVNDRDHHNRLVVDSLWTEVAQEMQKPVIECKTKWHQLRNNFARELRREKTSSRRSIWYLRKPLSFLTENILQSRSKKFIESTAANDQKFYKDHSPKMEMEELSSGKFEDTVAYDEYSNHQESREVETYEPVEEHEPSPENYEIPPKTDEKDDVHVNRLNDEKSADLAFFQSLFPDIQKLSARRKRKFKETILVSLNRLVDEEEEESAANYKISYSSNRQE